MKAVTANLLADGAVVYLADDDQWTVDLAAAARFADAEAGHVLAAAETRIREVAGAYLIDIGADAEPAGRTALREIIRRTGPTVRPDLGRQAGLR